MEEDRYRHNSLVFRPESAPTVIDMSPDGSLSGLPSVRNMEVGEHRAGDEHDDLSGK